MVFSSLGFLFLFLPVVLGLYGLIVIPFQNGPGRRIVLLAGNAVLLLFSLLFYFWGEGFLVWILLCSTLVDYVCGRLIDRTGWVSERVRPRRAKWFLAASITSNLLFLGYFKYLNFGADILRQASGDPQLLSGLGHVALPLGISFYTFQSMSYTIDVYRGAVPSTRNLLNFACYVTMFPQLVAGPVVRYIDVARNLVERRVSLEDLALGFRRFVLGLGKKVLIANTAAVVADHAFETSPWSLTAGEAWVGIVAYAFHIYFDFSGYSDMAIGLGRMLGFRFLENFNYPYMAASIQDFWRRWHISLSSWFRDYLFIPLGGSRVGPAKTYFNLVTVFFLCGLWHGASWNFVVWGLFHGGFLVLERLGLGRWLPQWPGVLRYGYVIIVTLVGWVLFRADNLLHAYHYLGAMFSWSPSLGRIVGVLTPYRIGILLLAFIACTSWPRLWGMRLMQRLSAGGGWRASGAWAVALLYVVGLWIGSLAFLAQGAANPFIYFRF